MTTSKFYTFPRGHLLCVQEVEEDFLEETLTIHCDNPPDSEVARFLEWCDLNDCVAIAYREGAKAR